MFLIALAASVFGSDFLSSFFFFFSLTGSSELSSENSSYGCFPFSLFFLLFFVVLRASLSFFTSLRNLSKPFGAFFSFRMNGNCSVSETACIHAFTIGYFYAVIASVCSPVMLLLYDLEFKPRKMIFFYFAVNL